jgi:hypothetical protein
MEKNSPIYNNKRFAQRSENYEDYERSSVIPEPAARASNWVDYLALLPGGYMKEEGGAKIYYPNSISNAKSFLTIFDQKFKNEVSKFISYMTMLNDNNDADADQPKVSWLRKNKNPVDQYNEFTNWSQSERQKYSSRFTTMLGTKRGAILQKALIALKNAEIAAAKVSFPYNKGVQNAEFMSDSETPQATNKPATDKPQSAPEKLPSNVDSQKESQKPEVPKYNYDYMQSIKKIKKPNHLVYYAAKQALGLKDVQDINSYYTKDNYKTIAAEITKIADSPYLNKHNNSLKGLKDLALNLLFDKVGGLGLTDTPSKPDQAVVTKPKPATGNAGPMSTTTGPDGEQKVTSPVETEAGREVDRLLDVAEGLDDNQLKRLWPGILDSINSNLINPQIDRLERIEFNQRLKDIGLRYNLAFHPEGGKQLSSGSFVVNTPEELARILRAALKVKDTKTANDAIDKLTIIFEENSSYVPYQEFKNLLRREIKQYNSRNLNDQVKDLPR